MASTSDWPTLPTDAWWDTLATLHLWTQVVGKIRLERGPWLNHSWGVALYVNGRGLTTSLVPYNGQAFEIAFDFVNHRLEITTVDGRLRAIALEPTTVARFYDEVLEAMAALDMPVEINTTPNEIADAIPFPDDTVHQAYDPAHAQALWHALVHSHRVFSAFRAGFIGKSSPVHFFWGSFDLAVTRFSGRPAPEHPGGIPNLPDDVAREAYSHEVTSVGFWPGTAEVPTPVFYAYAYPSPEGFAEADVAPEAAFWHDELGEFVLPYAAVQAANHPDAVLHRFLESTHSAAADLADWDRERLELQPPYGPEWWRTRPHG